LVLTPTRSWGNRRANGYQALAEDGNALLAERLRSEEERAVVRSVLERVLHVKLDMASVYAADAAAAQDALQTVMRSNAANDELVRSGVPVSQALGSVCAKRRAPLCILRTRCEQRVLITPCGSHRNKYKAEITEADSRADGAECRATLGASAVDANTMLILSK
jgi:hypothetical protein